MKSIACGCVVVVAVAAAFVVTLSEASKPTSESFVAVFVAVTVVVAAFAEEQSFHGGKHRMRRVDSMDGDCGAAAAAAPADNWIGLSNCPF